MFLHQKVYMLSLEKKINKFKDYILIVLLLAIQLIYNTLHAKEINNSLSNSNTFFYLDKKRNLKTFIILNYGRLYNDIVYKKNSTYLTSLLYQLKIDDKKKIDDIKNIFINHKESYKVANIIIKKYI